MTTSPGVGYDNFSRGGGSDNFSRGWPGRSQLGGPSNLFMWKEYANFFSG